MSTAARTSPPDAGEPVDNVNTHRPEPAHPIAETTATLLDFCREKGFTVYGADQRVSECDAAVLVGLSQKHLTDLRPSRDGPAHLESGASLTGFPISHAGWKADWTLACKRGNDAR